MTFQTADKIQESSTTTGTGALTLSGATTGHKAFSSICANGDVCYYHIDGGADWEVGLGTWGSGNLLTRTTLIASSTGSAVAFSAGSKIVSLTGPASKVLQQDDSGTLTLPIVSNIDASFAGVAVGRGAGNIASNTAVGSGALAANTTGINNTANGLNALQSNTTGTQNTASGVSALRFNTTGTQNTANGVNALRSNTIGNRNTASGVQALFNNTTGSGNTAVNALNSAGTYAPVFDPITENDRFCMGSTGVTNAYIQVAWTVVSDARDKTNFGEVPHGLEFVAALKPISYQFRTARDSEETKGNVRYGFRAQDILALEGKNPVIVDNEDADKLRMIDTALIPVLVKALQELNAKFDSYILTHP